jgi:hypothetical protein
MNGLTAENVRCVIYSLKKAIGELKKENQQVAVRELESVLALVDQMQRDNTSNATQPSRPDRVGDECWYRSWLADEKRDIWQRGILRVWDIGSEFSIAIVEDKKTGVAKSTTGVSFATEAPK